LDDPSELDADSLVRQAVAQAGAQQWNFIVPKVIQLSMRKDDQMYYTGINKLNERFSLQGKMFLIQVTNPVDINGAPIVSSQLEAGSLFLDWTVCFSIPQINPVTTIIQSPPTTARFDTLLDGIWYSSPTSLINTSVLASVTMNVGTVVGPVNVGDYVTIAPAPGYGNTSQRNTVVADGPSGDALLVDSGSSTNRGSAMVLRTDSQGRIAFTLAQGSEVLWEELSTYGFGYYIARFVRTLG
jgi:hypothetical protein